jgi:hypothetical protein
MPLSRGVWPGDFVELGDQHDDYLKAGKPSGTFPGIAPTDGTTATTASSMTALTGKASLGFGAIEARYQTIVCAIELPKF